MQKHLLDTPNMLEQMCEKQALPMDKVAGVLRLNAEYELKEELARRSSEDEIEAIETGLDTLFEKNPNFDLSTKELARAIHVSPKKQGNLARISRKAKLLRLTWQERHASRQQAAE